MCENTSLALSQVLGEMSQFDSLNEFISDMNQDEYRAFKRIFDQAEEFVNLFEDMNQFDEYSKGE
jgi:hypothetical protein